MIPVAQQPSWDQISQELEAYEDFARALARGEHPLPPLPEPTNPPPASGLGLGWGIASRLVLLAAAWIGTASGSPRLRLWSARQRIQMDKLWYEPASCSLNAAFTDLGLALLEKGDVAAAVECLRRSMYVHPCPHNTSFGLSTRLWKALAFAPEAAKARNEYENVARRFFPWFGAPRKRLTRIQAIRMIAKTLVMLGKKEDARPEL